MTIGGNLRRRSRGIAGAIAAFTCVVLAIIWFAAVIGGPEVCNAAIPAPENCFVSDRVRTGVFASVALAVTAGVAMAAAIRWPDRSMAVLVVGAVLLVVGGSVALFMLA